MTDRIELRGLRVVGIHGALPEEQTRAAALRGRPRRRGRPRAGRRDSDDLADTVDYGAVAERRRSAS